MIPTVLVMVAASVAAAGADTIAFGVPGAVAACSEHFSCADANATKAALDDAALLGIRCADGDPPCVRRLLAAEGFTRAVIYAALAGEVSVAVVETTSDRVRVGRGANASAALKLAVAPPPAPPPPPPSALPPPAPPPPDDATPWPMIIAASSGVGAVLASAGASFVSFSLAADLEAAQRGERPVEDVDARNAGFWALAGSAAALAVVAAGAATWALVGGEPDASSE